ncbi:hypothetical protein BZA70DRAFT_243969 [Myxozyma melibiosi]|uniref:Glycosyltransferase 2-like domain-containing protein n=1 Tax=Myxozyma melibiosi TaxID=54550 RepID=A0ABR1FCP4_9ASCO
MRMLSGAVSAASAGRRAGNYLVRCTPGLSTLLVLALILFAHDSLLFIGLTLVLHVSVVSFTVRSCYGMYITSKRTALVAAESANSAPGTPGTRKNAILWSDEDDLESTGAESEKSAIVCCDAGRGDSSDSLSSGTVFGIDDELLLHAIFLPNYKESLETMRETLSMLACHDLARSSYDIYLAMEEHEPSAVEKATTLIRDFSPYFHRITYTLHPHSLPGEARGKSSNISWSTRAASKHYRSESRTNVVFTVMDADTHLLPQYFEQICVDCATNLERANTFTMYVLPIVFDRNASTVSPIVRCADMLWCAAGISALYDCSQVRTPTSVYSITMTLARYVGFWDTGPGAIGEDLHMYLKCYFKTCGRLRSVSVFSPASHCNVVHENWMPQLSVLERWRLSSVARFMQACRHMWGIVDSGYAIKQTLRTLTLAGRQNQLGSFEYYDQDTENSDAELGSDEKLLSIASSVRYPSATPTASSSVPVWRTIVLLHRLYEAHFLPVHYFIDIMACSVLPIFTTANDSTHLLFHVLQYTNYLRTAAFLGVVFQLFLYEKFHATAIRLRHNLISTALTSPASPDLIKRSLSQVGFAPRGGPAYLLDYVLFPVAGTVFGAVPAIKAQIMQLWSTEFVYRVSSKPRAQ